MATLEERIQPALDAYATEIDRHHLSSGLSDDGTCKCGWVPPAAAQRPRTSLGLHIKAAQKAADAAYYAHARELTRGAR